LIKDHFSGGLSKSGDVHDRFPELRGVVLDPYGLDTDDDFSDNHAESLTPRME
jgi:hypothetical protein